MSFDSYSLGRPTGKRGSTLTSPVSPTMSTSSLSRNSQDMSVDEHLIRDLNLGRVHSTRSRASSSSTSHGDRSTSSPTNKPARLSRSIRRSAFRPDPSLEKERPSSVTAPLYEDMCEAAGSCEENGLQPLGRLASRGRPVSASSLANIGLCVMLYSRLLRQRS
jgi:hypothetical protein